MIRPQIANAVVLSILFASLAGGAALMIAGPPVIHRVVSQCNSALAR